MKAAVAKQPTTINICSSNKSFHSYSSGIFNDAKCCTKTNHIITAVGYGSEKGHEYLIVRNSWGTRWGEKGYLRIAIDKDGMGTCGILKNSVYPTTK